MSLAIFKHWLMFGFLWSILFIVVDLVQSYCHWFLKIGLKIFTKQSEIVRIIEGLPEGSNKVKCIGTHFTNVFRNNRILY